MADYTPQQAVGVPEAMHTRYKDMADGTHALVVYAGGIGGPVTVIDQWTSGHAATVLANGSVKMLLVPAGFEYQVLYVAAYLVTTGTANNRQLVVQSEDAATTVLCRAARAGAVQGPGVARHYTFAAGLADLTAFRDTDYLTTPLPNGLFLLESEVLRVWDNKAIDPAGDQLSVTFGIALRPV